MKNVRQGIFQTNSSSSHSLTVCYDDTVMFDTMYPNYKDEVHGMEAIVLNGGRFGWEWERFYDSYTKANYVAQDIVETIEGAEYEAKYTGFRPTYKRLLLEVISEQSGVPIQNIIFKADNDRNHGYSGDYGYIDHQSSGDAIRELFVHEMNDRTPISINEEESKRNLKYFIFHPDSSLRTGNDNEECPDPNYLIKERSKRPNDIELSNFSSDYSLKSKWFRSLEKIQDDWIPKSNVVQITDNLVKSIYDYISKEKLPIPSILLGATDNGSIGIDVILDSENAVFIIVNTDESIDFEVKNNGSFSEVRYVTKGSLFNDFCKYYKKLFR